MEGKNVKIADRALENVAQFKYFGATTTNPNWIHEEINSRVNSGNTCNSV
jgi:hypothetical protein